TVRQILDQHVSRETGSFYRDYDLRHRWQSRVRFNTRSSSLSTSRLPLTLSHTLEGCVSRSRIINWCHIDLLCPAVEGTGLAEKMKTLRFHNSVVDRQSDSNSSR